MGHGRRLTVVYIATRRDLTEMFRVSPTVLDWPTEYIVYSGPIDDQVASVGSGRYKIAFTDT
jgi:hypothetical protein